MQIIEETYNEYVVGNVTILSRPINKRTNKIELTLVRIIDIDKSNNQIIAKDFCKSYVFDFKGNELDNGGGYLYTKEQSIELIKQALTNQYLLFNGKEFESEKNKMNLLQDYQKLIKANKII